MAVLASDEAGLFVEQMLVGFASLEEELIFLFIISGLLCVELAVSKEFCSCGNRCVSNGIFQVVGDRLVEEVARDISIFHAMILTSVGLQGRCLHSFISGMAVESSAAFDDGICYRHDTWVADHAVGLASMQMPHW